MFTADDRLLSDKNITSIDRLSVFDIKRPIVMKIWRSEVHPALVYPGAKELPVEILV